MKRDPFPNEWEEISNLDDDEIETGVFMEVMDQVMTWHLPQPYCCVLRVYNRKESKLKEYTYKLQSKAHRRMLEAAEAGHEITILTDDVIGTINYPGD